MKKRFFNLILATVISVGCIFPFSACSGGLKLYEEGDKYTETKKGEPLPYYSLSYDFIGGKDVMPIGAYYGLYRTQASIDGVTYPNWVSDKYFALTKEMGVNIVVYNNDRIEHVPYLFEKWYALGEKYGIGYFANSADFETKVGWRNTDNIALGVTEAPTKEWMVDKFKEASFNYKYKSFLGLWSMDECYANHQLKNLVDLVKIFNECKAEGLIPENVDLYSNTLGYWTGLNNVSNTFTGGGWTWEEYMYTGKAGIPSYLSAGFKMLSTTQYPIMSTKTDYDAMSNWLQDLSFLIKVANEQHIPYWRMMQAGGNYGGEKKADYFPLEGQWMLDFNSALAFGCKGIQFFPLMTNEGMSMVEGGDIDVAKNGMFGIDGEVNQWWYYAKNATTALREYDHILMNSANVGIITHGKQAKALIGELNGELIKKEKYKELSGISGDDCFIGCFDYNGGTALFVVNSNCEENADVKLSFNGNYRYDVSQRGETVSVVGRKIPLTLAPGEGAMITLY